MWGINGFTVSNNTNVEPDPRIVGTTGNNAVIAWSEDRDTTTVIHLRKLSSVGQDLWSPATITLTDSIALSRPRIVAAESDGVILLYLRHMGHEPSSPRHLYMQKFSATGAPLWGDSGVLIAATDGISPQAIPEIMADSAGGAYACWSAAPDLSTYHAYAQHVATNGTAAWTANGVQVATTTGEMQMNPTFVRVPGGSDVLLFYQISGLNQSTWGVGGQKLNAAGALQWGTGVAFMPLAAEQCLSIVAQPQDNGAIVTYFRRFAATGAASRLLAFRVDSEGLPVWPAPYTNTLSAVESAKAYLATAVNAAGQVVAVWWDMRHDEGDIYLQNVNPTGTLGPLTPVPAAISITAPAESTMVAVLPQAVAFSVEHFLVAAAGGDGVVAVIVNGDTVAWHTTLNPVSLAALQDGDNEIILELVDYAQQPLDPAVRDTLHVLFEPSRAEELFIVPLRFDLGVYPNPFNARATVTYTLPRTAAVRLVILNTLGQEIAALAGGTQNAGTHRIGLHGGAMATGIYFVRLEADGEITTRKLILLK